MTISHPWLLIRADAGPDIGAGHVMRCLALAQVWRRRGGRCGWISHRPSSALAQRIRKEAGFLWKMEKTPGSGADAAEVVSRARRLKGAWVMIDGYHFTTRYQSHLKQAGVRLLVVDDHGQAGTYAADVILDQNITAQAGPYRHRPKNSQLLLGLSYVLLRQEFVRARKSDRRHKKGRQKILVTLGGSDPANVTRTILQALVRSGAEHWDATVLLGEDNRHAADLRQEACRAGLQVTFLRQTPDMPRWMNWSDVAVTGAGSTVWETLLMRRPSVVLSLAENQRPIAERLQHMGAVLYAKASTPARLLDRLTQCLHSLFEDEGLRRRLVKRGRTLVDGAGAERVVRVLRTEFGKIVV